MEAASPAPARRISVGAVLEETFSTYRDNFGALIGSALVECLDRAGPDGAARAAREFLAPIRDALDAPA